MVYTSSFRHYLSARALTADRSCGSFSRHVQGSPRPKQPAIQHTRVSVKNYLNFPLDSPKEKLIYIFCTFSFGLVETSH